MEILFVGLILVALMVYASTRIKRSAAAAFDPETVETDEFVIQKPEGFLNVVGGDEKYAFEAYSKEFGVDDAGKFRQGQAFLTVSNVPVEPPTDRRDEHSEVIDGVHYQILENAREEKGVALIDQYKVAERDGRHYQFHTTRLANSGDEITKKIEGMLDSFRLR